MSTSAIPMADPAAEYRALKAEIDAAVAGVLASGRYVLGPEGEALERELAAFIGAAHAIGVQLRDRRAAFPARRRRHRAGRRSGRCRPSRSSPPPRPCPISARRRCSPTSMRTPSTSIRSLRKCITPQTRAVIAVHLFGQCAALDEIAEICQARKLVLIEDCAQALGADYDGRRAGSWGDFGSFSFYPTKNLAAAGDAGLMTARSASTTKLLRMLRHHGSRQTYLHERVGWNSRLDELQAAILRVKLQHLEQFNAARRAGRGRYREQARRQRPELPAEHGRGRTSTTSSRSAARSATRSARRWQGGHRELHVLSRCRCTASRSYAAANRGRVAARSPRRRRQTRAVAADPSAARRCRRMDRICAGSASAA